MMLFLFISILFAILEKFQEHSSVILINIYHIYDLILYLSPDAAI